MRLWDYSHEWGNIQGIICPKFSFFIGMFYGVFIVDLCHSAQIVTKLKAFADENDVIIKYESLKSHIRAAQDQAA